MQCSTNLKAVACCQASTNGKLIYCRSNSCKLQKLLGNSVFEIRAIRENTRLIASCPCFIGKMLIEKVQGVPQLQATANNPFVFYQLARVSCTY